MPRLTSRDVSISATVNLLDFARMLPIDWDRMGPLVTKLEQLQFVDEVEDRHMFWLRLELMTGNAATAQRRIERTLVKIERIIRRYVQKEQR